MNPLPALPPASTVPQSDLRLTVLIVDDVSVIRMVLAQHVQGLGHRVVQASSGQEAIDCLRERDIDLVLLDLQMPDMTGFEVMRWMQDMLRDRWRPVIVISTHDTEAPVLQALECGADDYMTKPVHQRILSAKLRNFSSRVAAQRANAELLHCLNQQREELQERVDREAWVGARIQGVLLMGNLVQAAGGFEFAARAEAAKGVNGDFMDVLPMADGSVDIVLGDVMGKGLLAALMGAEVKQQISRTLVEQVAQAGQVLPSPADIVNSIHRALTPKLIALESFVTLVYLRLNRARQELTVVSCGHLPPVRLHTGQATRLGNAHLPMGILENELYLESRHAFLPGDALLIASDGLIEAQSITGDFYGQDRLDERGRAAHAFCATPGGLVEALRSDVAAFCDSPSVLDDLTMMVVTSPEDSPAEALRASDSQRLSLRLPRELAALDTLRNAVTTFLQSAGQDDFALGRVNLVLVEVFTNIVRHSQVRHAHAIVEIRLRLELEPVAAVVVLLESAGPPFEPPAALTPAPEPSLHREGGYGLHIVQSLTTHLHHSHAQGINQLRCRVPLAQSDDTCCGIRGCNQEH